MCLGLLTALSFKLIRWACYFASEIHGNFGEFLSMIRVSHMLTNGLISFSSASFLYFSGWLKYKFATVHDTFCYSVFIGMMGLLWIFGKADFFVSEVSLRISEVSVA